MLRVAHVSQWVVNQHHGGMGSGWLMVAELRAALEGGVVDRPVFWWQRGLVHRESLVRKPARILAGPEAEALGGRGSFDLLTVRPPTGRAAWTEIEVSSRTGSVDDVLVLELGGELDTLRQVLETLLILGTDGTLVELPLARRALVPGAGVPIVRAPFGRPVSDRAASGWFQGTAGIEFLVVRSQVEAIPDGAVTTNGLADVALTRSSGDWREGDRVFLRVSGGSLRAGVPAVVLGWKDRVDRPDGGDSELLRRSSRLLPLAR
jgi:hypothetical protein